MDILKSSTSRSRLRKFRERAAQSQHPSYRDWRQCRYGYQLSGDEFFPTYKDGKYFSTSLNWIGDNLGDSNTLVKLDYTGWYCDSFVSDVVRGAVIKIRCPKGTIYMAATYCTAWEGTIHYSRDSELVPKGASESEHEAAIREVARWADQNAKREADAYREDDAKFQAEQQIAGLKTEIGKIRAQARELIAAVRAQRRMGGILAPICQRLIADIKAMRQEVATMFVRIDKLQSDYWAAVSF